MGMDIRMPMGLMFSILGAVLTVYGIITNDQQMYKVHSLGININLMWGSVIFLFGLLMLLLSMRASKQAENNSSTTNPTTTRQMQEK